MKTIALMLASFGLGIMLSDFVKAQIAKLEKKNK